MAGKRKSFMRAVAREPLNELLTSEGVAGFARRHERRVFFGSCREQAARALLGQHRWER